MLFSDRLRHRMIALCTGRAALWALAFTSFAEAILFPVAPLMLLVPMCLSCRQKWLTYALTVAVCSTAGSLVTFALGYFLWDRWLAAAIETLGYSAAVASVTSLLASGPGTLVPLVGSFTPITYNVIAAVSGMMAANTAAAGSSGYLGFEWFLPLALTGRTLRFVLETWLIVRSADGLRWLTRKAAARQKRTAAPGEKCPNAQKSTASPEKL